MNENREERTESFTEKKQVVDDDNKVTGVEVECLSDYYKASKVTALQLFTSLKRASVSNLAEQDLEISLSSVMHEDPELRKTVDLVFQANKRINAQDNPDKVKVERQCLLFCGQVYSFFMMEKYSFQVESEVSTKIQFGKVVEKILPDFLDPKPNVVAVNLLKEFARV